MKTQLLFIFTVFLLPHELIAQADSTLQIIELDPQKPGVLISPSLSANLIGKGQWEVNIFNTLTTRGLKNTRITKRPFSNTYDTTITQNQFTRLENILQIQHGIKRHSRINVGLDLYISHLRSDPDVQNSPFRVLGNTTEGGMTHRDVSAIGPRLRWVPFARLPELTFQGSVVFGVSKDLPTRQLYGRDRTQVLSQITFYQRFQPWLYVFMQTDFSVFLKNDDFRNNTFSVPAFLYASANLWGLRSTAYPKVYGLLSWSYASRYDDNTRGEEWLVKRSFESQMGIGILSQFDPHWGVTLWGQKPIAHELGSASNEVIPGSWYTLSLGLRYLLIPQK